MCVVASSVGEFQDDGAMEACILRADQLESLFAAGLQPGVVLREVHFVDCGAAVRAATVDSGVQDAVASVL